MKRILLGIAVATLALTTRARAETLLEGLVDVLVDGGNNFDWQKVELPGTQCGNGSQYKFFVRRTSSPNLLFFFEGGGACWDFDTCSGRAGVLGAANPNGIADDYMTQFTAKFVSPIVNGADPGLPLRARTDLVTKDWNIVYMPYCTGDVHIGNRTATYVDQTGALPPLTWHHAGQPNTQAAIQWAHAQFPHVDKLLVTGFSAGGTATAAGYFFVRNGMSPTRGYYLDDSGPVYPAPNASFNSRPLHDQIRAAWGLDSVFATLPATFDRNDFGSINRMVALQFPGDQIAHTQYTRDFNYSRFSYERFLTPNDKESVLSYWDEDEDNLVAQLDAFNNTSYFLPFERQINASHCSTIITFIGSHACQRMEKKHNWWEYLEFPLGQTYKCYSEFVPMDVFLKRFIVDGTRTRIHEPVNAYNAEDPGMQIVAPLINAAIGG
ncbi:MAG TPA: pectin acetylesterase-family hydrolase [Kofleriaceae bacterium]|nr:pectin acetylesterase-family hydrolase [Kofleriaceae bacterium]